jgi:FeS assembly SUF system protein
MTDRPPPHDKETLADFMPHQATATADGGYRASAGEARPGLEKVDLIKIEDALKSVHDPEIPVNIFDLGLIYDINRLDDGNIHITMSLTAPGCPVAGEMPGQVAEAVAAIPEAGRVDVDLVWDPPWSKERMSEDAKLALDMVW